MPTISTFYGIIIYFNLTRKEHCPPHLHAKYGEFEATFTLKDGNLYYGELPPRARKMVKEFILKYKNELQNMWDKGYTQN